jgi:hypothetical protein
VRRRLFSRGDSREEEEFCTDTRCVAARSACAPGESQPPPRILRARACMHAYLLFLQVCVCACVCVCVCRDGDALRRNCEGPLESAREREEGYSVAPPSLHVRPLEKLTPKSQIGKALSRDPCACTESERMCVSFTPFRF